MTMWEDTAIVVLPWLLFSVRSQKTTFKTPVLPVQRWYCNAHQTLYN